MKNLLFIATIAVIILSCQATRQDEQNTEGTSTETTSINTLSEKQKDDGWILLFDGKTMNGWRFFKNRENNSWEVSDGTLHCKPFDDADKRADLITTDQYDNFEFAFDWKISKQGNSGVMFRVTEEFDQPYFSGPEYQILDDAGYPGDVSPSQLSGTNYGMHITNSKILKPAGEWNTARLVVNKDHVEHWLNDTKVVEYELHSEDWNKRKAAGKWKDVTGYGMSPKGHLDLQDHGNEVWFRNLAIKKL